MKKTLAFTLIELAVVLVIIGLLSAGILAGRELIRNAERRAIMGDLETIKTTMYAFRDKFRALPGDLPDAGRFWGLQAGATQAQCHDNSAATYDLTCSGDGNGLFTEYESAFLFNQLYLAGLTKEPYGSVSSGIWSTPKLRNYEGYYKLYSMEAGTSGSFNDMPGPHAFLINANPAGNDFTLSDPVLPYEEVLLIDAKHDDGVLTSGRIRSDTSVPSCTGEGSKCSLAIMSGF